MGGFVLLETSIPEEREHRCSFRFLLTRLPQSAFVSVTLQGQRVFVVERQPSFRRPALHARCTRAGKGNREKRERDRSIASFDRSGNSSTTQFPLFPAWRCRDFWLRFPQVRYLSLAIWLIIPDDPPRLSTSKPLPDILPICSPSSVTSYSPKPDRTRSLKLFLKY